MRYTKEHKVRTRGRIVERASLALREEGADGVSVAALMDLAGLTHGGFYAHFESREALVVVDDQEHPVLRPEVGAVVRDFARQERLAL